MSEVQASAETVNPTSEVITTDPWGDQMASEDAAISVETQEQENSDDGQTAEVREQSEPRDEAKADEEVEQKKDEKTVPYGALHEERQLRKEAKQEAAELREKMARMEERFQLMQEAFKPKEPEITFDDDPAAYLKQQAEKTNQSLEQLQKQAIEQQRQQQEAANMQSFMTKYATAAKEYSEKNPDFTDAYSHLVEGRVKEHMIAAGMSREQAVELAHREEKAIVDMAFQNGENPAERIVELAKLRGWTKKAQSVNNSEKVAKVEKGQQAAKTISKGGAADGPITLESLAEMDGEEFDKAWNKFFPGSE